MPTTLYFYINVMGLGTCIQMRNLRRKSAFQGLCCVIGSSLAGRLADLPTDDQAGVSESFEVERSQVTMLSRKGRHQAIPGA